MTPATTRPFTVQGVLKPRLLFLLGFCVKALPAALFEADAVRPLDKVLEAKKAAFKPVFLLGVLCCDKALPADD